MGDARNGIVRWGVDIVEDGKNPAEHWLEETQLLRIAKAIADPTRYRILKAISEREEICCGELASLFPIKQATVSHHLKVLGDAGLIQTRQQGAHHYYRLTPEALLQFSQTLSKELLKESP